MKLLLGCKELPMSGNFLQEAKAISATKSVNKKCFVFKVILIRDYRKNRDKHQRKFLENGIRE